MATCSNCGTEGNRVRSRWNEKNEQLPDECPHCAPASFEKFTDPSDKKIWMGYEVHPNEYVRAEDGGFDRKPEYRIEQEQKLMQPTAEEQEAQSRAVRKKRANRRIEPLDPIELQAALRKAEQIADWVAGSAMDGTDVVH